MFDDEPDHDLYDEGAETEELDFEQDTEDDIATIEEELENLSDEELEEELED